MSVENRNFSHPCAFNVPLKEFLLEFCNGGSGQKNWNHVSNSRWKQFDINVHIHFDTITERDRQMDGRIRHNNIALCMHRHADAR